MLRRCGHAIHQVLLWVQLACKDEINKAVSSQVNWSKLALPWRKLVSMTPTLLERELGGGLASKAAAQAVFRKIQGMKRTVQSMARRQRQQKQQQQRQRAGGKKMTWEEQPSVLSGASNRWDTPAAEEGQVARRVTRPSSAVRAGRPGSQASQGRVPRVGSGGRVRRPQHDVRGKDARSMQPSYSAIDLKQERAQSKPVHRPVRSTRPVAAPAPPVSARRQSADSESYADDADYELVPRQRVRVSRAARQHHEPAEGPPMFVAETPTWSPEPADLLAQGQSRGGRGRMGGGNRAYLAAQYTATPSEEYDSAHRTRSGWGYGGLKPHSPEYHGKSRFPDAAVELPSRGGFVSAPGTRL